MAISSPLLEASIDGAHGVLLSISGGSDLGLFEINEAAQLVAEAAHAEANIIFGAVIDDALGDEVRVTVIAAGFDGGTPRQGRAGPGAADRAGRDRGTGRGRPGPTRPAPPTSAADAAARGRPGARAGAGRRAPHRVTEPADRDRAADRSIELGREPARSRTIVFDDNDDLDIPDFLR